MDTIIHPIHPMIQFEAKHALRFLDNLLHSSTSVVYSSSDLFGAIPIFATGHDLKDDFATLTGNIGTYEFKWRRNSLECLNDSTFNICRGNIFSVDFDDNPCIFFNTLWDSLIPEVHACVCTAISHLAKAVSSFAPSKDGGVADRFKLLARHYRLTARECDLLLVGLCVEHNILEFELGDYKRRNFYIRLEEASSYIGCRIDDILPLVRNDAKLIACGILCDDLTPTCETLEYIEGHVSIPAIKAGRIATDVTAEEIVNFMKGNSWE